MTSIAQIEDNKRKLDARKILLEELPEGLRGTKQAFVEQRPYWDRGMAFVINWAKRGGPAGLILQGGVGRGKTELGVLMMFFLADMHGKESLYINSRDVGVELRGAYEKVPDMRHEAAIVKLAKERSCIMWDDVGGEGNDNEALHVKALLKLLIDVAVTSPKLFIMTANLDDAGLKTHLKDDREESRRAPWERIIFPKTLPDFRKRK